MGLLDNFLPKSVGVDVGVSSVKVVELSSFFRKIRLKNYARLEAVDPYRKPFRTFHDQSLFLSVDKVVEALRDSFMKAEIQPKKIVFAVADFLTFFTTFDLPPMKKEELEMAVQFEAEKHIPLPLNKVNLDWEVIEGAKKENSPNKILVVSIPNEVVEQYQQIAQKLNLADFVLEPETFSLHRLFSKGDEIICLVDIGAQSTAITIGWAKVVSASHSLDVSGQQMTEVLRDYLKTDEQTAEKIKRDQGLIGSSEIFSALEPLMQNLVKGIQDTIQSSSVGPKVGRVVLTGGSSKMPGLIDYLKKYLKLPVMKGDPFANIGYPRPLQSKLKEIGPFLSVAIGASLRDLQ